MDDLSALAGRVLAELRDAVASDGTQARIFFPRGIEYVQLKVALAPAGLELTVAGPDHPTGENAGLGAGAASAPPRMLAADTDAAFDFTVTDDLKQQIKDKKITFDPPAATAARLEKELLGTSGGTVTVTAALQSLALEVSKLVSIQISSIIRAEGLHGKGRAFDIGNEAVAPTLLPLIATDAQVAALKIDEIIFDAGGGTLEKRNRWNYDAGKKHVYDDATLVQHRNHIHLAVVS
jgi:hypothetical protein